MHLPERSAKAVRGGDLNGVRGRFKRFVRSIRLDQANYPRVGRLALVPEASYSREGIEG